MTTKIQLTDWEALMSELQQFGAPGDVTTDDERILIEFGNAYIEVRKDKGISTGMPLHDLEHHGDITLIVDEENGSITIKTEALNYTFRRP